MGTTIPVRGPGLYCVCVCGGGGGGGGGPGVLFSELKGRLVWPCTSIILKLGCYDNIIMIVAFRKQGKQKC